jgi:hypothetical protein
MASKSKSAIQQASYTILFGGPSKASFGFSKAKRFKAKKE